MTPFRNHLAPLWRCWYIYLDIHIVWDLPVPLIPRPGKLITARWSKGRWQFSAQPVPSKDLVIFPSIWTRIIHHTGKITGFPLFVKNLPRVFYMFLFGKIKPSCWWFRNPANHLGCESSLVNNGMINYLFLNWWSPDFWLPSTVVSYAIFESRLWLQLIIFVAIFYIAVAGGGVMVRCLHDTRWKLRGNKNWSQTLPKWVVVNFQDKAAALSVLVAKWCPDFISSSLQDESKGPPPMKDERTMSPWYVEFTSLKWTWHCLMGIHFRFV